MKRIPIRIEPERVIGRCTRCGGDITEAGAVLNAVFPTLVREAGGEVCVKCMDELDAERRKK